MRRLCPGSVVVGSYPPPLRDFTVRCLTVLTRKSANLPRFGRCARPICRPSSPGSGGRITGGHYMAVGSPFDILELRPEGELITRVVSVEEGPMTITPRDQRAPKVIQGVRLHVPPEDKQTEPPWWDITFLKLADADGEAHDTGPRPASDHPPPVASNSQVRVGAWCQVRGRSVAGGLQGRPQGRDPEPGRAVVSSANPGCVADGGCRRLRRSSPATS